MAVISPVDSTVLYTNEAWDTLFGYARGEILGASIEVVSAAAGPDLEATRRSLRVGLAEHGVWHGRVLKRRRSGEEFWSMTHVAAVRHEPFGEVWISLQTGLEIDDGGVGVDVIEQLAEVGTWELDLSTGSARVSARALSMLEIPERGDPLLLTEVLARVHPADAPRVVDMIRGMEQGTRPDLEFRVPLADGTMRFIHVRGAEVQSSTMGRVFSGVMLDVTDRHEFEDVLDDARADDQPPPTDLRGKDDQKDLFLRALSHDLRTPLTIMQGFASILASQDDRLSALDRRRYAERIAAGASRLQRQLNDLLDLDRLSRGVFEPLRQPTDLLRLATEAVEALDLAHRVTVKGDRVIAYVDPAQVERIVENLLANAVRHTPDDCRIEFEAEQVPDGVLIRVDDEGPGVPANMRESIFNVFQKVHAASAGTGIGLPLVRRFAEVHGGRAWMEDREGGGSAFRVFLPTVGDAPVDA